MPSLDHCCKAVAMSQVCVHGGIGIYGQHGVRKPAMATAFTARYKKGFALTLDTSDANPF